VVTIKKISKSEIRPLVEISYANDTELLEKFHHLEGSDLAGIIDGTMSRICGFEKRDKIDFYKVMVNKAPSGFFVVGINDAGDKFLYSFAIEMKNRKKEVLMQWWNKICDVLGKRFYVMLLKKNSRAIAWLLRCGMKIFGDTTGETLTLIKT